MEILKMNITREPKKDGGILVCKYGELLLELYVENNNNNPFYVKINNNIINSVNNKITFDEAIELNNEIIVYNINVNSSLIAVFNTKQPNYTIDHFIVYN